MSEGYWGYRRGACSQSLLIFKIFSRTTLLIAIIGEITMQASLHYVDRILFDP